MRLRGLPFLRHSFLLGLVMAGSGGPALRAGQETAAVSASDFLNSLGVCVHVQHRQAAWELAPDLSYLGVRAVRDGADGNFDTSGLLLLHQQAGVRVVFGPGSGVHGDGIALTIAACRELAEGGALLAVEGPNEPGNFGGVTYQGQNSTRLRSWVPVADFQRDLYRAVKSDPLLRRFPVYGPSECGAEENNVGLQFLTIPKGAQTLLPPGTRFADVVNCHNYVSGHIEGMIDNQATLAAATKPDAAIDSLFGNHGLTWLRGFTGYTEAVLDTIPKVTTETGWKTNSTAAGDDRQGKILLNVFLAQYKAHWKHTFIYELTDDADGAFGLFKRNLMTPRKAAEYLHNFTSILADTGAHAAHGNVGYSIRNRTATVHDLLLEKSDGTFELAVWGEQVKGANNITLNLDDRYDAVRVYDPTMGMRPVRTLDHVRAVPLTVSDHVLVVEFK
jgi:hypothetical protein